MARLLLAVCFALVLVAAVPAAQQKSILRSGVHTVPVYASVLDRAGRLVTGLTKDDFTILDDGKPQELTVFSDDVQPITIVVMLDRSGSVRQHFEHVRAAAEQFVMSLGDADRARIGSFSTAIRIDPVTFTNDRSELVRILRENLLDAGPTPLWNAAASAMNALRPETGRRVLLMFTDGFDSPLASDQQVALEQVRHQARAEEIMLYGIGLATECRPVQISSLLARSFGAPLCQARGGGGRGGTGRAGGVGRGGTARPRGPVPRMPGGIGGGGLPRFPVPISPPPAKPRWPGIDDPAGGPLGRPSVPLLADTPCKPTKPDPGLRDVATDTGGGYFELHTTDALDQTFARVANELRHQYLLGFAPVSLDGKTHALEVRARDGSLTVRARRSYVAAAK